MTLPIKDSARAVHGRVLAAMQSTDLERLVEIARQTGSISSARAGREQPSIHLLLRRIIAGDITLTVVRPLPPNPWLTVDWAMTTSEIAALLNVSCPRVTEARKVYAPSTVLRHRKKRKYTDVQWQHADWSKPIAVIAQDLGCTRGAVYARMKKMKDDISATPTDPALVFLPNPAENRPISTI